MQLVQKGEGGREGRGESLGRGGARCGGVGARCWGMGLVYNELLNIGNSHPSY